MDKYTTIFFDLDGTLTDPGLGITNSVMHALKKYNIEVPDRSELYAFIGPPLLDSFMKYYGFSEKQAEQAIEYYREHFRDKGIFENEMYPGIPEMLSSLRKAGKKVVLATSKPEEFARRILDHFDLMQYFDVCVGSAMDGTLVKKGDVLRLAMELAGVHDPSSAIMVGDRLHDIQGARENQMDCIGVLYGYGSEEELRSYEATYLASDVAELQDLLLQEKKENTGNQEKMIFANQEEKVQSGADSFDLSQRPALDEKAIEEVVRKAGGILLSARINEELIHVKSGDANFVTVYDVAVQEYLTRELSRLVPGCSFMGEEDTEQNAGKLSEGYCFIIDPIDGTTNFMFGYHLSCVSVGLAYHGQMVGAWVFQPYFDEMMTACLGQGTYLNGQKLTLEDKGIEDGVISFSCARYHSIDVDLLFESVKQIFRQSLALRLGGSATWDLCRTASGSNAAYVEFRLAPWDYAAASLIITEAGGVITQVDGSPITLDQPCSILGGSPKACAQIRAIVEQNKESLPRK